MLVIASRKLEPEAVLDVEDTGADPYELGEEWEAEIARRIAQVESGEVQGVPLEEVVAKIRAKFGWD